jgi:prolyl-tRNA synthetase
MRVSSLPRQNLLKIDKIEDKMTSTLLNNGLFFNFKNPGLTYQTPLGCKVVEKIERIIDDEHQLIGGLKIKIPGYIKREVLNFGEEINKTFSEKIISLPKPMEEYIALITHEMEILDWISKDIVSYKALPMRLFFRRDFIRPINYPKGILKLREFGVQAMLSVDKSKEEFNKSLEKYSGLCESIFNKLKINFVKITSEQNRLTPDTGFDLEYFYKCNEGENLIIPISKDKIKALSLSMGYLYKPKETLVHVVDEDNNRICPFIGTYAMGIERLVYSAFDCCRDRRGFNLPRAIRPFEVSILKFDDYPSTKESSEQVYKGINETAFFDDRKNIKRVEKSALSDLIGCQKKVIISKSGIRIKYRNNSVDDILFEDIEKVINYLNKN